MVEKDGMLCLNVCIPNNLLCGRGVAETADYLVGTALKQPAPKGGGLCEKKKLLEGPKNRMGN